MESISSPVVKKDHLPKVTGRSVYVGDYRKDGLLVGRLLHSQRPHAKILDVIPPPMPPGYLYVGKDAVPGENVVHIVADDCPVFAGETVEYVGEPIGMVVGPDEAVVRQLVERFRVSYEDLEPVLDLQKSEEVFYQHQYQKGDVDAAFAQADSVYEEIFSTGCQEHAYLETQGMMAELETDGRIFLHGSMQNPYYVQNAVIRALGCGPEDIHVRQDVTGGAFGGKADFPSILGCQVAVAAKFAGKPVRCVFDRREDMAFTSKRHPVRSVYRIAVKDKRVTAMDITLCYDAGAYRTLSDAVLRRGMICAGGSYRIENLRVTGSAVKTNTPPNGAFRGFGEPQSFYCVELAMSHLAQSLGLDPISFKAAHTVSQGDCTSTNGRYHFPVPLEAMREELDAVCDLLEKRTVYQIPQSGRYRRGIGYAQFFHGAGITGAAARQRIPTSAGLRKRADGTVEIFAANSDIGQGLRTTFPKIVANELNLPLDKVFFDLPDTARVPDSGPTVGSRSVMTAGELLRRCAVKLRSQWKDGEEQVVEEQYHTPDFMIPFNPETFQGDAYPTYSWAVNAVEVEVDTVTGTFRLVGAYGVYDVGTPMDWNVVLGQMEGGFLQGLGFASMEDLSYNRTGHVRNGSLRLYHIPTAQDAAQVKCLLHVEQYPDGPYGAKGAGELPVIGAAAAWAEAVEMALGAGCRVDHIPFTPEDVLRVLAERGQCDG